LIPIINISRLPQKMSETIELEALKVIVVHLTRENDDLKHENAVLKNASNVVYTAGYNIPHIFRDIAKAKQHVIDLVRRYRPQCDRYHAQKVDEFIRNVEKFDDFNTESSRLDVCISEYEGNIFFHFSKVLLE